jgi:hypothetical protein
MLLQFFIDLPMDRGEVGIRPLCLRQGAYLIM